MREKMTEFPDDSCQWSGIMTFFQRFTRRIAEPFGHTFVMNDLTEHFPPALCEASFITVSPFFHSLLIDINLEGQPQQALVIFPLRMWDGE